MFRLFKAKPEKIPSSVALLTLLPGSEGEHFL